MVSSDSIILYYNQDYDEGIAEVRLEAKIFEQSEKQYHHEIALFAAGILATATDSMGCLGKAEYLAPALAEQLKMHDISLYSYGRCEYDTSKVRVERLGRSSKDFAFSISHMPMQGENAYELILLTLRGTESFSEGLGADFFGTLGDRRLVKWCGHFAYRSFARFAKKVLVALAKYEKENLQETAKKTKIYLITGHSLGGAATQLVASKLTDQGKKVFAYTFGSLNAITQSAGYPYPNIWNILNYYDTYGPRGYGAMGFCPAKGRKTIRNKFGNVLVFKKDYRRQFKTIKLSKNHIMGGYYQAIRENLPWEAVLGNKKKASGNAGKLSL